MVANCKECGVELTPCERPSGCFTCRRQHAALLAELAALKGEFPLLRYDRPEDHYDVVRVGWRVRSALVVKLLAYNIYVQSDEDGDLLFIPKSEAGRGYVDALADDPRTIWHAAAARSALDLRTFIEETPAYD